MVAYLPISPLRAGVAGGIIGLIVIVISTIAGILGYSRVAKILEESLWNKYGYYVSWKGAIWGGIIGFIYGFIIMFLFTHIYNMLV